MRKTVLKNYNVNFRGQSGSISHLCDLDKDVCMATVQVIINVRTH